VRRIRLERIGAHARGGLAKASLRILDNQICACASQNLSGVYDGYDLARPVRARIVSPTYPSCEDPRCRGPRRSNSRDADRVCRPAGSPAGVGPRLLFCSTHRALVADAVRLDFVIVHIFTKQSPTHPTIDEEIRLRYHFTWGACSRGPTAKSIAPFATMMYRLRNLQCLLLCCVAALLRRCSAPLQARSLRCPALPPPLRKGSCVSFLLPQDTEPLQPSRTEKADAGLKACKAETLACHVADVVADIVRDHSRVVRVVLLMAA
jgi:hypothetical protein